MIFHIMVLYIYFDNEITDETNMKVFYMEKYMQK